MIELIIHPQRAGVPSICWTHWSARLEEHHWHTIETSQQCLALIVPSIHLCGDSVTGSVIDISQQRPALIASPVHPFQAPTTCQPIATGTKYWFPADSTTLVVHQYFQLVSLHQPIPCLMQARGWIGDAGHEVKLLGGISVLNQSLWSTQPLSVQ